MRCWQLSRAVLISISLVFVYASPSSPEDGDALEKRLARMYDWTLLFEAHPMPKFMHYKESGLQPYVLVRSVWRASPRGGNPRLLPSGTFQDLWFHQGKAVGCRHYFHPEVELQQQGAFVVRKATDPEQLRPIANSLVRTLLECQTENIPAGNVIVPSDLYDSLEAELRQLQFLSQMPSNFGRQLSLRLISDPAGKSSFYYYQKLKNAE